MAVTPTPIFVQAPRHDFVLVTTANATLDSPAVTSQTFFTAGANGSRVNEIVVQGYQAAIAAGVVRIFISEGTEDEGHLFDEFLITAVTGSTTAVMFRAARKYENLYLEAGDLLVATTSITQNFALHAFGGDF